MKCLSKKILCYIICGLLTFSLTSTVYYRSVHAMEWVGGALAFEEALKWLLAAIGITATAGMTDAYWDTYGDDFTDYAIENGATQTEVAEWQLKACQGIIDKGSVVWDKFKSWANSLLGYGTVSSSNVSGILSEIYPNIDLSNLSSDKLDFNYNYVIFYDDHIFSFYNSNLSYNWSGLNLTGVFSPSATELYITIRDNSIYSSSYYNNKSNLSFGFSSSSRVGFYGIDYPTSNQNFFTLSGSGSGGVIDSNFDSVTNNVNDLDVISSDGVNENEDEVTTTMPGVSDSDNEASKDAYQDIIDAINDGTITQEKGIEQIQEILKVITYDTVTDEVVPPQKNDDGTDKTKDDALKENKENMRFTLGGLEAVFPFCIPFDIYAFMTLLVADPVCPEFDFPIKSVNGQVEEIHIDLDPFEPVAVVVRYCFDFLFIIGLAMLTRSLIGGGSSD